MQNGKILITDPEADYELLDSGEGEKLERFGKFTLSRPDPQALWRKKLEASEWKKADGRFMSGEKNRDWSLRADLPGNWNIQFAGLKFCVKPTAFKHVGLFPEQKPNWEWVQNLINERTEGAEGEGFRGTPSESADSAAGSRPPSRPPKRPSSSSPSAPSSSATSEILNLFGYTGGATLACAQAGAKVVHVDGSKAAIAWAKQNAELSSLADKPIRWILDDARSFVKREIKRGRAYDGIIMDPPAFGHGPENELWKIEEHLLPLVEDCFKILKDKPSFFLVNGYSSGYSSIGYENLLLPLMAKHGGVIESGELAIRESGVSGVGEKRLLPCGIFARWKMS